MQTVICQKRFFGDGKGQEVYEFMKKDPGEDHAGNQIT